jgi:excisionase family DNA binding protein
LKGPTPTTRPRAPRAYTPDLGHIEDAAGLLAVNPRTVRRMLHDGELSAYRVRSALRVDMNEIRDLLQPVPPDSVSA